MIIDNFNTLTQTLASATVGDSYSTDAIDIVDARNIGQGQPLFVVFTLTAAMVGAGATLVVALVQDSVSSGSAVNEAFLSSAFFSAVSPAGTQIAIALPPLLRNPLNQADRRYLRLKFTVAGATLTSTTMQATIVPHVADGRINYPSGFVFSTSGV